MSLLTQLFGESPIQKHERKSKEAISTFQDTVEKLSSGNLGIDEDISKEKSFINDKEKEILEARQRVEAMNEVKAKNTKWVDKINEFFELD